MKRLYESVTSMTLTKTNSFGVCMLEVHKTTLGSTPGTADVALTPATQH